MPNKPDLKRIIEVNQAVNYYREAIDNGEIVGYEAEIDRLNNNQHVIFHGHNKLSEVEAYWENGKGIGRRMDAEYWMPLSKTPVSPVFENTIEMLGSVEPDKIESQDNNWVLEFSISIPENPAAYYEDLLGEPRSDRDTSFRKRLLELTKEASGARRVTIAKDSLLIRELKTQVQVGKEKYISLATFMPLKEEFPSFPSQAVIREATPIPAEILLLRRLNTIGGWPTDVHCRAAQLSLDSIRQADQGSGRYREIYNDAFSTVLYDESSAYEPIYPGHHPIVLAAFHEDANYRFPEPYLSWFSNDERYKNTPNVREGDWWRSMLHFGGYDTGLLQKTLIDIAAWLDDRLSLDWLPEMPSARRGDHFLSARDWGYGEGGLGQPRCSPEKNLMTFCEAIRQYNSYTFEGKQKAYLMVGHVIHLLQDQGQPDHAKLVAHPASGFSEEDFFRKYWLCEINAALLFSWWNWLAMGAYIAACELSLDHNHVGFEKFSRSKSISTSPPNNVGEYDTFFSQLAEFSMQQANVLGLRSPLGLGDLFPLSDITGIPGLVPEIDIRNPASFQKYLDLYNAMLPKVVSLCAGMIQYFYEIVNHPPFLKHVEIIKGTPGRVPSGFGRFRSVPSTLPSHCRPMKTCYEADWIEDRSDPTNRNLKIFKNEPLSPYHCAYVFLQFGPELKPLGSKRMDLESSVLTIKYIGPDGREISTNIPINEAQDPRIGTYYWGSFNPENEGTNAIEIALEVNGRDMSAHYRGRGNPNDHGYLLDTHPEKAARVEVRSPSEYPLIDYVPGIDRSHRLTVAPSVGLDYLEPNNSFDEATPVDLSHEEEPDFIMARQEVGYKEYPRLILSDEADTDCFFVRFYPNRNDDGGSGWIHDFGGIAFVCNTARLLIDAAEEFGSCLSIELHDSNMQPWGTALEPNSKHFIELNAPENIADHSLYVTLKNPDYSQVGPLIYSIGFEHSHKSIRMVGTRVIMRNAFKWLPDWVMAGDPTEVICNNPERLIADLKLCEDNFIKSMAVADRGARERLRVAYQTCIGRISHSFGKYDDAEEIFNQCISDYSKLGIKKMEAQCTHILQSLYKKQNRLKEAKLISARLSKLGNFEPFPEVKQVSYAR
jgi:hypothetical protein